MRDFLPAEKRRREYSLGVIRRVFAAHGFDEIETPVMEDAARLHAGLGGDNEKLAFGVLRRGLAPHDVAEIAASGDLGALTDLGLRYDLTVPLARFYATHRSELGAVFKAIQIAPVWRAERPQKGRYRQFMQCDIDIIGEAGMLAEVELITATAATLDALGLPGCTIRINDRRLLIGMLDLFGFPAAEHESVLITIDKLDKVGQDGVLAELRDKGADAAAVDALRAFFHRQVDSTPVPFGVAGIRSALPTGVDREVIAQVAEIGLAATTAAGSAGLVVFDPFLVRGMGYYTGTIFEIVHPSLGYSLGGGGRYDGMIGRFLGTEVPACGFSIGFERLVDLLGETEDTRVDSVVLVHDRDLPASRLLPLKTALIRQGARVRLEPRSKNLKALLERAAASGYQNFGLVTSATQTIADLELRALR
ncbi:MAG: histidine--tRNA ligase [Microbacteriaceae bacterium]